MLAVVYDSLFTLMSAIMKRRFASARYLVTSRLKLLLNRISTPVLLLEFPPKIAL